MSYYPPQENLNRIDAIKKKFEDAEKKHEKPIIKRTPAFRCDRIVCGKNVTNVSPKNEHSWTSAQSDSEVKTSGRKDSSDSSSSLNEGIHKSFSENNLLKQSGRNDYIVKVISQRKNIFAEKEDYKKLLAEYAVVNKKKKDLTINDQDLTILQSPLPPGPPPKKPPRIFTHTTHKTVTKNETRLKLEKLENFILKSDKNSHVLIPRKSDYEKNEAEKNTQSGLSSLNCLSVCLDKESVVENKKINRSENEKNVSPGDLKNGLLKNGLHKKSNLDVKGGEPIYAQPYIHNGTGSIQGGLTTTTFDTFGKPTNSPPFKTWINKTKTESPLHYMCTDLNQPITLDWRQAETLRIEKKPNPGLILPRTNENKINLKNNQSPPIKNGSPTKISQSPFKTGLHTNNNKVTSKPIIVPSAVGVVAQRVSHLAGLPLTRLTPSPPSAINETGTNHHQLKNVKIIMDKAFGPPMPDTASLDSEEETLEEINESDLISDERKSNTTSPASSPSLNSVSSYTDNETLTQITDKRKIYVKRVSSLLVASERKTAFQVRNNSKSGSSHLFESCLLIGLTLTEGPDGKKENLPYIKHVFPSDVTPPPLIEFFCFPDADSWPPPKNRQKPEEQSYSIVITNERGERKFGYCRRVLPEGGHFCLPLAYCIISPHRATGFYYNVLQELESRHGSPELNELMQQLYDTEFPNPGQSLKLNNILERVKMASSPDSMQSTLVRRPIDIRLENRDVTQLFRHLSIPVFLRVFSTLLIERRVLLLGNSLSTLSCCIEALQSILYPFSWQHTYVPVLPAHLLELCDAPTPFIIGVLKQSEPLEAKLAANFSEGIMVDIEENRVICCCKDENSILPPKLRKSLRSALNLAITGANVPSLSDAEKNVLVSEAFLRFFVEVCGHYSYHLVPQQDGTLAFQKETFIKSVNSSSKRSFLEWFTETAMFHVFIQDREDFNVQDLFSSRSTQHSAEVENNLMPFRNMTNNKKGRTLGDRFKDFTTFNK